MSKSRLSVTKDILWSGGRVTNHLSRLRYFRGHGVHSPFVYAIVRYVFMGGKQATTENQQLKQLIGSSVKKRVALELTSLAKHCGFDSLSIDSFNGESMIVCSEECSDKAINNFAEKAANSGTAIVILAPYRRRELCNSLLKSNCSTSIDRFNYLIFLNNYLPKQHFKL